jgi:branched-subunit amino acid ABC-type transport system permease component
MCFKIDEAVSCALVEAFVARGLCVYNIGSCIIFHLVKLINFAQGATRSQPPYLAVYFANQAQIHQNDGAGFIFI